jgi:hypothetical protein
MFSIYLTGLLLVAAVSLAVAAPFLRVAGRFEEPRPADEGTDERSRWRKQKDEALAGIREAEFDFHLGKLSETDYRNLRRRLEEQALQAIHRLEGEAPRGDDR